MSVCLCLSPAEVSVLGSGLCGSSLFSEGMRSIHLLPAFNTPFAALRFTCCKTLWLHGLCSWVISRSVDQDLLILTHLKCCQWCLVSLSTSQLWKRQRKFPSLPGICIFMGEKHKSALSQGFRMFLDFRKKSSMKDRPETLSWKQMGTSGCALWTQEGNGAGRLERNWKLCFIFPHALFFLVKPLTW